MFCVKTFAAHTKKLSCEKIDIEDAAVVTVRIDAIPVISFRTDTFVRLPATFLSITALVLR